MATQNANAVAITGGITSGVTGIGNTEVNLTLSGAASYGAGGTGSGTFPVYSVYAMPALAIDVTQEWNTVILTGSTTGHPNEVLTFTGTPANAVQEYRVMVKNTDSVVHTPTVPSSWSFNGGATETSFRIQPSSFVFLTWDYDGSTYFLRGDPRTVSDLGANSAASILPTNLVAVEPVATPGVMSQEPVSSINIKSVVFSFNGNGGVLTTGTKNATLCKVPYGGTLIGWTLICYPSGTITVDIYRSTNGSGTVPPSASIIGAGTPITVNAGTYASWANFTNWTSTSVAALDNFVANLTADGTVQVATVVLYYE